MIFSKHKPNIVCLSLIYNCLFLYNLEIFIYFRMHIFLYVSLLALLEFMGEFSISVSLFSSKYFLSSPYFTLSIRYYYISDDG